MKRRDFLSTLGAAAAVSATGVLRPFQALAQSTPARGSGPFEVRFGYHAITWGGKDLQAIQEISESGFHGIQLRANVVKEYGDKPAALKELLARHKLTFVSMSSGNVQIDPANEKETIALHARHAQFVKDAGGLYLQVTDERPKGRDVTKDDLARMGRLLTEIGKRSADLGVGLAYHNHMNNLGEKPEEIDGVLAASDPKVVRLLLDIAHYKQGGGDPAKAAAKHADRIMYIHAKDVISPVPGDTKPPARSYKFVELGQGSVNIPAVFDALEAARYRGWAIVELDGVPDKTKTPKQCMEISKKYIEETLKLKV